MNPAAIIAAIEGVIKIAAVAVNLGKDIAPHATAIYENLVNGKEVTQADIDALEAEVDAMHGEVQRPLPPADQA